MHEEPTGVDSHHGRRSDIWTALPYRACAGALVVYRHAGLTAAEAAAKLWCRQASRVGWATALGGLRHAGLEYKVEPLELLSSEVCVASADEDYALTIYVPSLLPSYLQRTGNLAEWLAMRAIDSSRRNARLLKSALGLRRWDDISTVLHVNAATVTDNWWVRRKGEKIAYEDVRFTENSFDKLALRGETDSLIQPPSRTPELTNTGSFEKCWRMEDGSWWLYKAANETERFTEVFSTHLANAAGMRAVAYEPSDNAVRCRDFTHFAAQNFDPAVGYIGDASDYVEIYDILLRETGADIALAYVQQCYFDALLYNMDRHEHNFGLLRDGTTGEILSFAPLFDHNIALITRGYRQNVERYPDILVDDFLELVQSRPVRFVHPDLTEEDIRRAVQQTNLPPPQNQNLPLPPEEYVVQFVWNAQQRIREAL